MCLINVPNLKEINLAEGWLKIIVLNQCKEEKMWRKPGNFQKHISRKLLIQFTSNLVYEIVYMEGIKYVNLIEISPVVTKIWSVENGDLRIPVNNTLVCRTSFLALTHDCVSWCIQYSKPWLHSDIRSSCHWSLHTFTFRYNSTLLGHAIFKPSTMHRPQAGAHLVSFNCFCLWMSVCLCMCVSAPEAMNN